MNHQDRKIRLNRWSILCALLAGLVLLMMAMPSPKVGLHQLAHDNHKAQTAINHDAS